MAALTTGLRGRGRLAVIPGRRYQLLTHLGGTLSGDGPGSNGCPTTSSWGHDTLRRSFRAFPVSAAPKITVIAMVSAHQDSNPPAAPAWDTEQLAVITAPADARLIVTAGPGTGKTAVACGRVAHLITKEQVEPSCVMLLSFTRTAVAEIRNRIAGYVGSAARASGIRIATIDSTTWSLVNGLDPDAERAFRGYDANIDELCGMLRAGDGDVLDYLERIEHFVIDEAQDVLGNRAELISQLIRRLPGTCGVTVLADACQSIYGFTNEDGGETDELSKALLDLLPATGKPGGFHPMKLSRLHRTSDESLIRLLSVTRPIVEAAETDDATDYRRLRQGIMDTAPWIGVNRAGLAGVVRGRDDLMVLYRTRAEVLYTASYLASAGVAHRLRISGLPAWLHPWIAVVLSDFKGDTINEAAFHDRWRDRDCDSLPAPPGAAFAWQACINAANDGGRVRLEHLRMVLSRPRPPVEFCALDNGFTGPILGTVHGAKGREAEDVLFFLPNGRDGEDVAWDEESRVLYVGISRARRSTSVGQDGPTFSRFLDDAERPVRLKSREGRAQFEVGRMGDIDELSVVSLDLHGDAAAVARQQQRLAASANKIEKCVLRKDATRNYAYQLLEDGGGEPAIGEMSPAFMNHIWAIARCFGGNSPSTIPFINKVGVRTIAVSPDCGRSGELAPPYCDTGFFLAPVVRAWTMTRFRW
jgi:hypothetical protein